MQLVIETGTVATMDREQATARTTRDVEFEQYMAARQPSLLRTAYLLTGDRHSAEDLVQTSLAKLYLSWDKVQKRELLDGYVRRIMVNENNSLWRRAWKRREVTTDEVPDRAGAADRPGSAPWSTPGSTQGSTQEAAQWSTEWSAERSAQSSALWDFVQTLPRKQRAVVVLRYYEDLSEAEVAEILGISVGTVKSQSSRALAALRKRVHTQPILAREALAHEGEEER